MMLTFLSNLVLFLLQRIKVKKLTRKSTKIIVFTLKLVSYGIPTAQNVADFIELTSHVSSGTSIRDTN